MRAYLSEALVKLNIQFREPKQGDAGYDLYAIEAYAIPPGGRTLISTGIYLEIPNQHVGIIKDRSSMASAGLQTMGGVIDSAYRGEVKVLLLNTNNEVYEVKAGQKIAQMVVIRCYTDKVVVVESFDDLSATERGDRGFGSTGQ
ncbi:MAG: dUTP diphosphatase [Anaerolineae bacterium]|nr:dUTP diphosphatase [Anaerolineae bacterium]